MRDNLAREVVSIVTYLSDSVKYDISLQFQQNLPSPSEGSPHPRLLGSLRRMLSLHYKGGMTWDTLCFHEVHADDPLVIGPNYVDIHVEALPDLEGDDFWWKVLPPHGELLVLEIV